MENMKLEQIANYAHGVGPNSKTLFETNFLSDAREHDLKVHPW
jgi:glycerophosphoryl diester phosphodiesterase